MTLTRLALLVLPLLALAQAPASHAVDAARAAEVLEDYADHVHRTYVEALEGALGLRQAVERLATAPSPESLAAAREAWLAARPSYGRSEAFRYYDGPIDYAGEEGGSAGPEGRLNAWPLNEAYIDAVAGAPGAGLVNDPAVPLTRAALLERNQRDEEAEVSTGYHAIEFLLWGQDTDPAGPGARPLTDYVGQSEPVQRRRAYLSVVTDLLVEDLTGLVEAWAPGRADNYRARFLAVAPAEALGRAFTGLATLSGFELASERLATALDSGDQEDEQSCFSDSTHQDILANVGGVAEVYLGRPDRLGLGALLAEADPDLDARLTAALQDSLARAAALDHPFDRTLASPPDSPERARVEGLVAALQQQADLLQQAGRALGADVQVLTE